MQKDIASTIKWLSKLSKVFFSNAPRATTIVIIMTLLSQFSSIVALLLPLKVIMLLGSTTVPNFVPPPLNTLDRDTLILSLGMLSLVFYAIMILTNKMSVFASGLGVKKILAKNHKFILFRNQDDIATNAYLKFAEGISGLTFSIIGVVILLGVYSGVGVTILTSFSLFIITTPFVTNIFPSLQRKMTNNPQIVVRSLSDVAFLGVFIFILIDFLYFSPPTFIAAVFTIILARITLSRLTVSIIDLIYLQKQATKINTLFFHEKITPELHKQANNNIWQLAVPEYRDIWIKQLLKQHIPIGSHSLDIDEISIECYESGARDILSFFIKVGRDSNQKYLIKLFDSSQSMAAQHEATLLTDVTDPFPAPPLISVTQLKDFHCHIFDITASEFVKPEQIQEMNQQLQQDLLSYKLSDDFVNHYLRSKQMIWDELTPDLFARLKLFANDKQMILVDTIEQNIAVCIDALKALPLRLDINVNNRLLLANNSSKPLLIDWHKWQMTPLATGTLSKDLSRIQLIAYCHENNESISESTIALALLIKKLVVKFGQQNYNAIFDEVLPMLVHCINDRKTLVAEHQTQQTNINI